MFKDIVQQNASTPAAPTMQDILLRLQSYWTAQGCIVAQPFNTEVGAGTANPATALRVLGPEPWRVAYVEPSVRPDDSRYGENPNRLQTHTQFQVILKPEPGNPQELYLNSLEAIGVDPRAHDIRFVEDNWASPALGAWGLGWEVWLDGLEISQFTYFQQVGGLTLNPVSVEITYGIERIVMALQSVSHFKSITYAAGTSYGEVFGQIEYEMSRYYLDDADIEFNRRLFENFSAEARRMIESKLPVPAYYLVLKCSHVFNVLDARGAISTTERAQAFREMRALTLEIAQLWAKRREELGYPLGVFESPPAANLPSVMPVAAATSKLAFEIGVEELPHAEVVRCADLVRDAIANKLGATQIEHGQIRSFATPRRISVVIDGVSPQELDAERTIRGPRVTSAFDASGAPTKAGLGFARANGVEPASLETFSVNDIEYVGIKTVESGRNAVTVLSKILGDVVTELRAEQNMRWKDEGLSFARPVRWIVALLGEQVVPIAVSSLTSGRITRVHRYASAPEIEISSADDYLATLDQHGIMLDGNARRADIVRTGLDLAAGVGGLIDEDSDASLLDEVANLVEQPHAILGSFDRQYLELPAQILETVMRKHQRYLPVRDREGHLLPHFVSVANGECDERLVRAGFEAVLRARYEDAAFFWRADLALSPEQHKAGLDKLTFAENLGSVADRAERIAAVASRLAECVALTNEDTQTLARASELAKFDLASNMVTELSSLAGYMAFEYAIRHGETSAVATALVEMEMPTTGRGRLPETKVGALLSLADRFDLLLGLFAVDARITGSSDPFGLRRAAGGVVRVLRAFPDISRVTLSAGLRAAAEVLRSQGVNVSDPALHEANQLLIRRYEQQLLDAGITHNLVQAVIPLADAPATADKAVDQLQSHVGAASFNDLTAALQRARRIVPPSTPSRYDRTFLGEPAELALIEAFENLEKSLVRETDLGAFIDKGVALIEPINKFFDDVLVMADDVDVRASRLGLLSAINTTAGAYLDWSAL